ncbi:unnamed protein product [Strongylus vulgaris]|uniref:Uncharacterized protein n=1 Tax=Strongylus vulgaris TaxID=40348 RepID=A0A3P7LPD1_STRVU|nr:unnamed protein product [Strongylus vulgaris]
MAFSPPRFCSSPMTGVRIVPQRMSLCHNDIYQQLMRNQCRKTGVSGCPQRITLCQIGSCGISAAYERAVP